MQEYNDECEVPSDQAIRISRVYPCDLWTILVHTLLICVLQMQFIFSHFSFSKCQKCERNNTNQPCFYLNHSFSFQFQKFQNEELQRSMIFLKSKLTTNFYWGQHKQRNPMHNTCVRRRIFKHLSISPRLCFSYDFSS